jgi:hypothetical protein
MRRLPCALLLLLLALVWWSPGAGAVADTGRVGEGGDGEEGEEGGEVEFASGQVGLEYDDDYDPATGRRGRSCRRVLTSLSRVCHPCPGVAHELNLRRLGVALPCFPPFPCPCDDA